MHAAWPDAAIGCARESGVGFLKDAVRIRPDVTAGAVRGAASERIVRPLRDAGAKDVRISSPPLGCPCHFGTDADSPKPDRLYSVADIA